MKTFNIYFQVGFFLLVTQTTFSQPSLNGKMVYHTYSDYNAWDSELYVFDFSTGDRTHISATWNIDHEMNAHWSPDGTMLVFMGDVAGEPRNWDIFIWTVGGSSPINLTNGGGRDEDPKFSPNGQHIVFKNANDLWQMDLTGNIINNVTNTPSIEESMPFYTADGNSILYAPGVGSGSDIYKINTDGSETTAIAALPNIQEYFPITRDNDSYLYTSWQNSSDLHDQIYLRYFSGQAGIRLPFNTSSSNFSDSYPIDSQYLLLSSDKPDGKGNYDLYVADINSGQTWSLDSYNPNINSSQQDLGACYNIAIPLVLANQNPFSPAKKEDIIFNEIQIVPNPSYGNFIVQLNSNEMIQTIHLINPQGKNVAFDYHIHGDQLHVDSLPIEGGVFVLLIQGLEKMYHAKLILIK